MQMFNYFLLGAATSTFLQYCSRFVPLWHKILLSLVAGVLFCLAGFWLPWGLRLVLVWFFLWGLVAESYVDLRYTIILDEILLLLLLAGIAYNGVTGCSWRDSFLGALTGSAVLGLVFVLSKGGLGLGDVKFAGVLGIWTGISGILVTLYLSFFIGGIVALLLCVTHRTTLKSRIPFGPCLSAGAAMSFFFSSRILDWYWSLLL